MPIMPGRKRSHMLRSFFITDSGVPAMIRSLSSDDWKPSAMLRLISSTSISP